MDVHVSVHVSDTHYASLALLQALVVDNQELLPEEAQATHAYQSGPE